eukprot:TRINITY_DN1296_c0_g2_i1.p1 TRINITY_DN1296_c0_g2~~TRINITY_DN1296_c0_g2_i1.p1  ORF type:complete len:166 (+),score=55.59 TRINITY_DN1296_c0_g2_i1:60-500(+)
MSDYMNTLGKATGLLGLKMCVTHLLTVRTRFIENSFKTNEDTQIHPVIGTCFTYLLGAFGPSISIPRLHGVVSNSLENESIFFAIYLMIGLTKTPTEQHIKIIWAFVVARYIQAFSYLLGVQPYRAFSFVAGLMMTIFGGVELVRN